MTREQNSVKKISRFFLRRILLIMYGALVFVVAASTYYEVKSYQKELRQRRAKIMKEREKLTSEAAWMALNYIDLNRIDTQEDIRAFLKHKAKEACAIAENVYGKFHRKLSHADQKQMLVEAFRPFRFNKGRGYYFLIDPQGVIQLSPINRELEGINLLEHQIQMGGEPVNAEFASILKNEEGFFHYLWNVPGSEISQVVNKTSFLKKLPHYDWYIGVGEYEEIALQEHALVMLSKLVDPAMGKGSRFLVLAAQDGRQIFPSSNNACFDAQTAVADEVYLQLKDAAQIPTGRHVIYSLAPGDSVMAYAVKVPDWDWLLVAESSLKQLEKQMVSNARFLYHEFQIRLYWEGLKLLLGLLIIFVLTRLLSKRMHKNFGGFKEQLQNAISHFRPIQKHDFDFLEFHDLATSVNGLLMDRSQAREALQKEQVYSHQLFENSPAAIALTDDQLMILKVNPRFCNLFGYQGQEVEGMNARELLVPRDLFCQSDAFVEQVRKGVGVISDTKRLLRDGTSVDMNITGVPVILEGDKICYYWMYQDISERKMVEQEIRKAQRQAEESDRLKTAFLANMSHEIRTPMNAIIGFSDLLVEGDVDEEEQRECLQLIHTSGNALMTLIDDIIDISKIEAGQIKIRPGHFDLSAMMKDLFNVFQANLNMTAECQLQFDCLMPDELAGIQVFADEYRIRQVIVNLLSNAVKFTQQGSICFGCMVTEKEGLKFFVKDTGTGIPQEMQEVIFERFRQVEATNGMNQKGTGLGLAITQSLVELHGGKIWVESEMGQGASFYFTLPHCMAKSSCEVDQTSVALH